jgi:sugar lactone lactonase YvrE/Tfp pilus assembly protein PilX
MSPRPDAGFSIVLAVSTILILMLLGMAMVALVVEDSDLGTNQVQSNQALYAAHAGIEYAVVKIAANGAWTGLPSPGKTVGAGSFWIAPPDTVDENGNPLASGRIRIIANGVVGGATRSIQAHVAPGLITAYAGTGTQGYLGDGAAATAAQMRDPEGVSVATNGDLYIADTGNEAIRKVNVLTGVITTVAGTGIPGYTGDAGPATSARLKKPEDVVVAANGDLYIADTGNFVIRKVTAATGVITTVAGDGFQGSSGDGGAATSAKLRFPAGVAVAANGDIYIGDTGNERVRKVTAATGIITAFAGTGTAGYLGDGGAATSARLRAPEGVTLASNGDLYIADTVNHAIRRVSSATGVITTYAGTGTAGFLGDGGAATSARLSSPQAVRFNSAGDLYIADTANNRIRRVQAASGTITTIAGTGTAGNTGDGGPATAALLSSPRGITVSATGAFYIGDQGNDRARKVMGLIAVVAWVETRS